MDRDSKERKGKSTAGGGTKAMFRERNRGAAHKMQEENRDFRGG